MRIDRQLLAHLLLSTVNGALHLTAIFIASTSLAVFGGTTE